MAINSSNYTSSLDTVKIKFHIGLFGVPSIQIFQNFPDAAVIHAIFDDRQADISAIFFLPHFGISGYFWFPVNGAADLAPEPCCRQGRKNIEVLKKTLTIYLPLLIVSALFLLIFFGGKGIIDLNIMKMKKERIVQKNEVLVQKNLSLHQTVVRLKDDPAFIENVARKDLGLIKENEIILKLKKKTGKGPDDD